MIQNNSNPAEHAVVVVPSDAVGLKEVSRGIYVGTSGDLNVKMVDGTILLFPKVPGGVILPIRVSQVYQSGTTATNLISIW